MLQRKLEKWVEAKNLLMGMVVVTIVIVILISSVFCIEKQKLDAKLLALIALLAALAGVSRVPFAIIPGLQPTTFLVILSGAVYGSGIGFSVGVLGTLISNCFLGHGPWTAFQAFGWGVCGASAGVLSRFVPPKNRLVYAVFGFVWGFLFSWIVNLWHWMTFVDPLSFSTFVAVNLSSLWFDLNHAVGNAFFIFLFGPEIVSILLRFKKRLQVSYKTELITQM